MTKMLETDPRLVEAQHIKSLLKNCLEFVERKGLLLELPKSIQDYALAQGDDAAKKCFDQFKRRISKDGLTLDEYDDWGSCSNADDRANLMAGFLPTIEHLAALPKSESLVFKALNMLWEGTGCDFDVKGGSGYGGTDEPYLRLDDATVIAILRLQKLGEIPDISKNIKNMECMQKYRADYGLKGVYERSCQLMKEIDRTPGLLMVVRKALAPSRMPPEVVTLVERQVLTAKGVTHPLDRDAVWGAKRPVRKTRIGGRRGFTKDVDAEWDSSEHDWVFKKWY